MNSSHDPEKKPTAWMVHCPLGNEFDFQVFTERSEAENAASQHCEDSDADEWEIIPLFAGEPEVVKW